MDQLQEDEIIPWVYDPEARVSTHSEQLETGPNALHRPLWVCAWVLTFFATGVAAAASDPDVAQLARALDSDAEGERFEAAFALAEMGPKATDAIPALVNALRKESRDTGMCADALIRIGPAAVPALLRLINEEKWEVRDAARDALQEIGPRATSAIPVLLEELKKDEEDPFRCRSIRSGPCGVAHVGTLGSVVDLLAAMGPGAVPALCQALHHPNTAVRGGAAYSLGLMGSGAQGAVPAIVEAWKKEETRSEADSRLWDMYVWALGSIGPAAKPAVPLLQAALAEFERSLPGKATRLNIEGNCAPPDVEDSQNSAPLAEFATLGNEFQKAESLSELAVALVNIAPDDERTLAILLDRLRRNEFPMFFREEQKVWSAFGGDAVVGLVGLLKHENKQVRSKAEYFLGKMTLENAPHAESAVPVLIELLGDEKRRNTAADLLGNVGLPARAALAPLTSLLTNRNSGDDLSDVARAVATIDPGNEMAIRLLVGELNHNDPQRRERAAWDLQEIGQSAATAVPALIDRLDDENPAVRRIATEALGAMGPAAKSAIPALVAARYDEYEPNVSFGSEGSVYALGKIGPDALPSLLNLLKDGRVGGRAVYALGHMGPAAEPAVDELLVLLSEGKHSCEVAATLGEIGPGAKKAVPALRRLLMDKCRVVRKVASEALEKIGG